VFRIKRHPAARAGLATPLIVWRCKCAKCGHTWTTKSDELPDWCAGCRKPHWWIKRPRGRPRSLFFVRRLGSDQNLIADEALKPQRGTDGFASVAEAVKETRNTLPREDLYLIRSSDERIIGRRAAGMDWTIEEDLE
jgi:hypothetical protein